MKRILVIMGSLLLVGAMTATAFSWGPESGRGRHTKGYWDRGPASNERYGGVYGSLTEDQRAKIEELDRKFYDETVDLRDNIRTKSAELGGILNDKEPDVAKAKALLKEINDLKGVLAEKGLDYQFEVRKIVPDLRYGRGYGMDYGPNMFGGGPAMGYGPRMFGDGPRMGYGKDMRGYGPGHRWN